MNQTAIAEKLKQLLIETSPLIEEHTKEVCPACTDVCCKQKHGIFRERDVRYLHALGIVVPPYNESMPPEGPCQFLGPEGCVNPRWLRPWKCTWYFCDSLLRTMEEGSRKECRQFIAVLQDMVKLYDELIR